MENKKRRFSKAKVMHGFKKKHVTKTTHKDNSRDQILESIAQFLLSESTVRSEKITLLEIGCREAKRLRKLSKIMNIANYGIEPSAQAVAFAKNLG